MKTTPQPRNAAGAQSSDTLPLAAMQKMLADREARITETETEAAKKAEADKAQAAKCASARSEYQRFADGRPQFHLNDAGNRVAFTYAELDAQRESTRRQMDEACAG